MSPRALVLAVIVVLISTVGLLCGGANVFVRAIRDVDLAAEKHKAVCERATTEGSLWLQGTENDVFTAKDFCADKLRDRYVPCSILEDVRPYFCSTLEQEFPENAETVTVWWEECTWKWNPHCSNNRIGEYQGTEMTFY